MTSDAEAVSTREIVEDGFKTTIATFADGSISVSKIQQPTAKELSGEVSLMSIGSCQSVSSGSGYSVHKGCLAYGSNGYLHLQFRADFTLINGAPDQLNRVYSAQSSSSWGSSTPATKRVHRSQESGSRPAWASVSSQFTSAGGLVSYTGTLNLFVGNNSAWTRQDNY